MLPRGSVLVSGDSIFNSEAIGNYLSNFNVLSTQGSFKYEKSVIPIRAPNGDIVSYKKVISSISFEENPRGFISIVMGFSR